MNQYHRSLEQKIKERLFEKGKVIVLYGPRQVGKTTLAMKILADYHSERGYFNCEDRSVTDILSSRNASTMRHMFGEHQVIVLDEAQTIKNVGLMIKIYIDAYPDAAVIATGSSSFDLANEVSEPLTGRHYEYFLYPVSFGEIAATEGARALFEKLNTRLVYGNYPEILNAVSFNDAREKLRNLAGSYLYKDIFKFGGIKNPEILENILRALAHQVGNEVSLNEIARLVGADKNTVAAYIRLLEQAFVIFRLSSFSGNLRNEIKRGKKFYFYDNGIISSLTENFSGPETGRDVGALWENLMVGERLKKNQREQTYNNLWFWRLAGSGEIDLVEEYGGRLHPFEFKWSKTKATGAARSFRREYQTDGVKVINRENFLEFVL